MCQTSDQIKSYESDSEVGQSSPATRDGFRAFTGLFLFQHEADIEDFSDLEDSLTRQKVSSPS